MSTIKISQLDSIDTLNTTDILPVVNEGETKRMTVEKLGDIYATKQYVINSTSGKLIEANITWGKGLNAVGEYPNEAKTIMSDVINQLQSVYGSYKTPRIQIALDAANTYHCYLEPFRIGNKYGDFYFNEYGGSFSSGDDYIYADQYHVYPGQYQMRVQGSWDTGEFVASSVSRIKNIDYLSKSATTGSYTPQYDISPATKKYVDDNVATKQNTLTAGENITIDENNVISASGGESFPTIPINWIADTYSGGTSYLRNDETGCNNASKLINDIYKSGYKGRIKVIHSTSQKYTQLLQPGFAAIANTVTTYNFTNFTQEESRTYFNITDNLVPIRVYHLCIKGTWENDVFTCTQYGYGRTWADNLVTKNGLLTKDNTASYTPTANYHPATKKYVDDAISTAITDALGGEY